ncbi:MAG: valine--tRNA ligase [Eubacteriales bacterium]
MEKTLSKTYDPKEFEDRIYKSWEENGAFKAKVDYSKKPYTIVMPPPNITGQLHMGHAFDNTLQDVLIRWKRMQGFNALWVPGSDHASIATEVKVAEKIREEEGKTKEEIGRDEFLRRAWQWKETYGGKITNQIRKLGNSCDWDRERFTMDEGCNVAVKEAFVRLYEKGLIYRGYRIINWCPSCKTSLSDAEVEHEERSGKYYYYRYNYVDGSGEIVIATSRPETMFADTAIAVHPDDDRYRDAIGKLVYIPLTDIQIPIIADQYPDPTKGSGAVKITPSHDPNDFEVGVRHKLEMPSCINLDGTMGKLAGKYEGMDRFQCRKLWVSELESEGFLIKTEDKEIPIGGCYRCDTIVEPMLSEQWFVKMQEIAAPAIEAAKSGELKHVPDRFERIYLHWLENIRDWCISRQLWWGHRIPAYYCQDCGEIIVSKETPTSCGKCNSTNIKQDEDVLDTWFSSALWPFSTLGWPEKTEDFKYFYPTDVLVTGYDIIFFWVIRMVFSGIEMTGQLPFKHIFVHGLVRDAEGRKMSKSLGNGVDPIEIIQDFGADALRFTLITGVSAGNDMKFQIEKVAESRNFANKLWNATRFIYMGLGDEESKLAIMENLEKDITNLALREEDKWIISRINTVAKEVTANMEKFELALAAKKIYELIWNEFCDWYIEIVKPRLYGKDQKDKMTVQIVLINSLKDMLKLLHPFMPFITEEIWSTLPSQDLSDQGKIKNEDFLMLAKWPEYSIGKNYPKDENTIDTAMGIIKAIRNIRVEAEATPKKPLKAYIFVDDEIANSVKMSESIIKNLANISEITYLGNRGEINEDVTSSVVDGIEIFIPLDDLIDYAQEIERLAKEIKKFKEEVERIEKKLSNPGFVGKAPDAVINEEKEKLAKYRDQLLKVQERAIVVNKKLG